MAIAKQLTPKTTLLFHKADRLELSLCQYMNRMGHNRQVRLFFK